MNLSVANVAAEEVVGSLSSELMRDDDHEEETNPEKNCWKLKYFKSGVESTQSFLNFIEFLRASGDSDEIQLCSCD
ncbi:hypothetical protein F2Q69_00017708 [Brassica cretica]|uniref:Uncharacterized protein n=1 Tax=Brassica cretica TaxID=69181 RepID=A0A8S9QNK4_BRACR|nr:hypothetical protein F2Q69_00017708 [Brassica cretica]